jgi:hypothetical protein
MPLRSSSGPRAMPRSGVQNSGLAMVSLAQLDPHTGYASGVLGPLIVDGFSLDMVISPSISTGTFNVAPQDAGAASATVNVAQQLGASIGLSLVNTIFASAVTSSPTTHPSTAQQPNNRATLTESALARGYDTAFWWIAGIFAAGGLSEGLLLPRGPLVQASTPAQTTDQTIGMVPTGPAD